LVKFIRKRVIGIGITLAVIGGGVLLLSRFDIGSKLTGAAGGAGSFLPNVAKAFTSQFAVGAGELGTEVSKISENFQRSILGGLLGSELEQFGGGGFAGGTVTEQTVTTQPGQSFPEFLKNAFNVFKPVPIDRATQVKASNTGSVFNVASAFTRTAQQSRILQAEATAAKVAAGTTGSSAFGGFDSALAQEAELQKQIALSREKFPEFFKVVTS